MARKKFSAAKKREALTMLSTGGLTQQQIAKKIGCSISALTLWRQESQKGQVAAGKQEKVQEKAVEEQAGQTQPAPCAAPTECKKTACELRRQFWNQNFRGVDMLLAPRDYTAEEVVELVNEALAYAHSHCVGKK